jgi:hypothetical protein
VLEIILNLLEFDAIDSEGVIDVPSVRVAQNFIGLLDFSEFFLHFGGQ